ncbi:MAG: hypothetical protein KatS3mg057_0461 [Herpetosiphonaceae bacterium]|nr:MAG: hypothetical protein KatS3mg057_0461 [Herpetosiphonaceae bacterium]
MIWRLVQLKFQPDRVDEFLAIWQEVHTTIRRQPGCLSLMLLRDTSDPAAFATWSCWTDRRALQIYRRSNFFGEFWPQVKTLLREPAQAVSYEQIEEITAPQ